MMIIIIIIIIILHLLIVWFQHSHYYVKISRFMPRVELVQKHNTAARRLFIRGHNGKIYPYLVVNDSGLSVARREERVLQLLRMLNHYLGKQKVSLEGTSQSGTSLGLFEILGAAVLWKSAA